MVYQIHLEWDLPSLHDCYLMPRDCSLFVESISKCMLKACLLARSNARDCMVYTSIFISSAGSAKAGDCSSMIPFETIRSPTLLIYVYFMCKLQTPKSHFTLERIEQQTTTTLPSTSVTVLVMTMKSRGEKSTVKTWCPWCLWVACKPRRMDAGKSLVRISKVFAYKFCSFGKVPALRPSNFDVVPGHKTLQPYAELQGTKG